MGVFFIYFALDRIEWSILFHFYSLLHSKLYSRYILPLLFIDINISMYIIKTMYIGKLKCLTIKIDRV